MSHGISAGLASHDRSQGSENGTGRVGGVSFHDGALGGPVAIGHPRADEACSDPEQETKGFISETQGAQSAQVHEWPRCRLHRGQVCFILLCLLLGGIVCWVFILPKLDGVQTPLLVPIPPALHVLVTGGAGYIGSHTSLSLLEAGHHVTIIDNLSRGNLGAISVLRSVAIPGQLRFIQGDLGDADVLAKALSSPKVDLVFHLAAVAFPAESVADPLKYYMNVSSNTFILLQAMQSKDVNSLVFSSTCAVYGAAANVPFTEHSPVAPVTPYGKSKLVAEMAIQDFARTRSDFRAVILRFFNVYGADPQGRLGEYQRPGQGSQFPRSSSVCFNVALGRLEEFPIMGTALSTPDGTAVRDFIHVADLVKALLLSMQGVANPPRLYNVGTGKGMSVREFVQACGRVTRRKIRVREQAHGRVGDPEIAWANSSKIQKELNWTPSYVNLEEGLATAWYWRRAHPDGY